MEKVIKGLKSKDSKTLANKVAKGNCTLIERDAIMSILAGREKFNMDSLTVANLIPKGAQVVFAAAKNAKFKGDQKGIVKRSYFVKDKPQIEWVKIQFEVNGETKTCYKRATSTAIKSVTAPEAAAPAKAPAKAKKPAAKKKTAASA